MRKCKGIGEVAFLEVAEVGLRMTRARTAPAAAAEAKERKRKVGGGELELSRSVVQLKSRRLATVEDSSASPATSENLSCASISSNHVLASCCSSSGLSGVDKESFKFLDLEEENEVSAEEVATSTGDLVDCNERRDTTTATEVQTESEAEKMPSEAELEEFFAAAEKNLQKKFADKYNYDIVKDEPLEGRYEWVQLQVKP
ncbi:Cyclin-dependent kinase inhibitor [Abeliophyllum distichum]|uniref:Cyclin-dependent kinase inhibitor n=1 Tax=Abeliophyllum distichum TaxID=126358 RepID=A0ABD1SGH6_9LAMI